MRRIAVVAESRLAAQTLIADLQLGSSAYPFAHDKLTHSSVFGLKYDIVLFSKSVSPPSDQAIVAFHGSTSPDQMFSLEGDMDAVRTELWLRANPPGPKKMPQHIKPPDAHIIMTSEQVALWEFRNEQEELPAPLVVLAAGEVKEFHDGWAARNTQGTIEMRAPETDRWIQRRIWMGQ